MLFVDAAGNTMTVEFTRTDVDSPWLPVQQLWGDRGIGFGNQSPRLPTLALLRERELSPALWVRLWNCFSITSTADEYSRCAEAIIGRDVRLAKQSAIL